MCVNVECVFYNQPDCNSEGEESGIKNFDIKVTEMSPFEWEIVK
jgi:hypothetical protein